MRTTIKTIALTLATTLALAAPSAQAQGNVIKIVHPFGPGTFDTGARALAEGLAVAAGRPVIVESKPGAGGRIGTDFVAKSKPDGNTLLFTTGGHATTAGLYDNLPYDALKDFTPITITTRSTGWLVMVRNGSKFKSLQEVIAASKAAPGSVSYGSYGVGNGSHIMAEQFARAAGIKLLHVPYRSPIQDFLAGVVELTFSGNTTALPFIKDGRARALATSAIGGDPELPGVPTFAELGLKEVNLPAWSGLMAPAGIAADKVDELYKQISAAAKGPAFQNYLKMVNGKLELTPPPQFRKQLEEEVVRFKRELPELGIRGTE